MCSPFRLRTSLLFLLVSTLLAVGCRTAATRPALERHEFSRPEMGLPFRIVLFAENATLAGQAAEAAFARISELNGILSDYDDASELSRLSATSGSGQVVPVSPDLWEVLRRSQELARRTGGAFDVTVGPLVQQWRRARRQRRLPEPGALEAARARVGYDKLRLDPRHRTATLLAPGMRLDLGAIAKGYAIDEALKVLAKQGVARALVMGGGDMAAGEPPPDRPAWRVELAPLDAPGAPPARHVLLRRQALATSGDVFQHVEIDGVRYSHIVDPRTGVGLTDHSLVTVIARDCMTADSLATAVSVLGIEPGMELIHATRGAEVRIARRPGEVNEVAESPGFRRFYE